MRGRLPALDRAIQTAEAITPDRSRKGLLDYFMPRFAGERLIDEADSQDVTAGEGGSTLVTRGRRGAVGPYVPPENPEETPVFSRGRRGAVGPYVPPENPAETQPPVYTRGRRGGLTAPSMSILQ